MLALGEVWRVTGQWTGAEAINREALQAAEVLDDVVLQARAQCALADVLRLQGHYDSALAWLAKAQDGFEQADQGHLRGGQEARAEARNGEDGFLDEHGSA
jgi:ATP/maltotriose-dependent transcriptional regulator MalT